MADAQTSSSPGFFDQHLRQVLDDLYGPDEEGRVNVAAVAIAIVHFSGPPKFEQLIFRPQHDLRGVADTFALLQAVAAQGRLVINELDTRIKKAELTLQDSMALLHSEAQKSIGHLQGVVEALTEKMRKEGHDATDKPSGPATVPGAARQDDQQGHSQKGA